MKVAGAAPRLEHALVERHLAVEEGGVRTAKAGLVPVNASSS